ncbi:MAG TPA: TMEM175 family protein [Actinomycetospora sp.]|nr:TMEM175 family protein [Actinomycetospora sp.]
MTNRTSDRDGARLAPDRLLAFSDAVVAIALTVLVLPLAELVPDADEPDRSGLTLIQDNLAPIGSFLLSFVVIGAFWAAHHRLFARAADAGRVLVWWNFAWLLTIVVLPVPTKMVGSFEDDPFTLRFYVGTLFVSSGLLTVLTVLVGRSLDRAGRAALDHTGAAASSLVLLVIFVLTLIAPGVGYWPLLLLLVTFLLDRPLRPITARWIEPG